MLVDPGVIQAARLAGVEVVCRPGRLLAWWRPRPGEREVVARAFDAMVEGTATAASADCLTVVDTPAVLV